MKIALVSPYDFAYPGGVTNHISSLEHYLTQMGHEVKVIAPASKAVSVFGDRFIPIGRPRAIPTSGSIARVTISIRLSPTVKAVLAKENFDIIHLHEPFMPMLCTTVLRMSQTKTVGTFHAFAGRPAYNFAKPITIWWLKKWFRKLDGKIAVSEPAMEFANKHLPGHYDIIPNGIDIEHFSLDVPPIDEFGDGKLNILFVGRLEKRKGVNYLIKAYQRVKEEIPNSRLVIVGPGTRLRHKYERQVRRNGLRDVVSSNIDGYARLITHGVDGLLVPPRDDKMLAQALISVMSDESLRQQMGAKGVLKAKKYDWKHIAQRILDYYTGVLSRSPQKEQFVESEAMSV